MRRSQEQQVDKRNVDWLDATDARVTTHGNARRNFKFVIDGMTIILLPHQDL